MPRWFRRRHRSLRTPQGVVQGADASALIAALLAVPSYTTSPAKTQLLLRVQLAVEAQRWLQRQHRPDAAPVAITTDYAPYMPVLPPPGPLVWLDPTTEDGLLASLVAAGYAVWEA